MEQIKLSNNGIMPAVITIKTPQWRQQEEEEEKKEEEEQKQPRKKSTLKL